MSDFVLDASAVLALALGERGGDRIEEIITNSAVSTVNLTEAGSRLLDRGITVLDMRRYINELGCDVVSFDKLQAFLAAELRPLTRHLGLSLGDRACLALGRTLGLPVITADRSWEGLDVGVEIQVIR